MTEPKEPTVTREDIKELIDEFRPAMWDGRNVRIVAALRLALTTKDAEQQIATLTAERDAARAELKAARRAIQVLWQMIPDEWVYESSISNAIQAALAEKEK